MIIKLISRALILFTAYMGLKHGWQALHIKPGDTGPEVELFNKLNVSPGAIKIIGVLSILGALLILAPQTFFIGNLLNAVVILFLMAMFLNVSEIKATIIEVPFLIAPLLLIYLKYPFEFS
ncbi:hypothetical protein ACFP1I_18105 [Dyadobacter subterraneus]|uniref:DoxX-like family protein n=1 Tax=Dyadobacter subterraneus TaxID=2773304 RepID=A0ABR9WGU6_9BACT|nr:hypothetical protein [Dyadobacter subterraneus]MBE9464730.1 hypothetical protein [Dyadobacter subterraneus]